MSIFCILAVGGPTANVARCLSTSDKFRHVLAGAHDALQTLLSFHLFELKKVQKDRSIILYSFLPDLQQEIWSVSLCHALASSGRFSMPHAAILWTIRIIKQGIARLHGEGSRRRVRVGHPSVLADQRSVALLPNLVGVPVKAA